MDHLLDFPDNAVGNVVRTSHESMYSSQLQMSMHLFSISVVGISQNTGRLGDWSAWTECSESCGGGRKARVRKCLNVDNADYVDCIGDMKQIEECNTYLCPGNSVCLWQLLHM